MNEDGRGGRLDDVAPALKREVDDDLTAADAPGGLWWARWRRPYRSEPDRGDVAEFEWDPFRDEASR